MPYEHRLLEDEKRELLRIARATLKEYLSSGRMPPGAPHRASMLAPAAVFVTLRANGTIRGSVGSVVETAPLYRTIQEMAIAAASRDPRFPPVRLEDLADLTIEVSVLGPRTRVYAPSEICIGTHGVCVSADGKRGLLLPQAAVESGWDAETFLSQACQKAGLPPDTWHRPDAILEVFQTQDFAERGRV